jgi:prepilin-type N-terminal cleavage/methylation domain-containing protein/prepilin-type processing-associated H-X9-DG protein
MGELKIRTRGFTLIELLVVIAVVAILASIFLPRPNWEKKNAMRINCANNLKKIGLACRLWSSDAGDQYPMLRSTNFGGSMEYGGEIFRHFQCMSNELGTAKVLVCVADKRVAARTFGELSNTNISYFIGLDADETMPQMFLAGDRNLAINGSPVNPGLVLFKSNDMISWTSELHGGQGNVGLADGSVQQVSTAQLQQMNRNTGTNLNRLAFP